MTIQKLIDALEKSTNKDEKIKVEISAFKTLEIKSVHYFLNGEIVISTKGKG